MSETLHTSCPLDCPDACSLEVTVEKGRLVSLTGSRINPGTEGFICGKVRSFRKHVEHEERLRHPLIRTGIRKGSREGRQFRQASWDEALDVVAERMRSARERSGGESILPFSYGGSNGRLTQDTVDATLFRRLGASRLLRSVCAAPTTEAAEGLYGRMAGVAIEDYPAAKLIVIWGANPAVSGIHLVPQIQRAQRAGAKLMVIDPRRTLLARSADLHLAPLPGTDLPLALSIARQLFAEGAVDEAFLRDHVKGVERLRDRAQPWTIARAAETCGLAQDDIVSFVRLYADSNPAVVRCGWGLERNRNGGSAVCAVLALPALAGKFGVRGGGYTMSNSAAWKLGSACDDPEPPTRLLNMNHLGRDLVELDPPIEVLFVYDSNPLATLPNQEAVKRGLEREDLFTVVFDQVLTDTARYADVVLPATTFLEHDDLRNSFGSFALQRVVPVIDRIGEARPNYEVFQDLLLRLGLHRAEDGDGSPQALTARILKDHPEVRARLDEDGVAFPAFGDRPIQFVDVFPNTSSGKIELAPGHLEEQAPEGLYAFQNQAADSKHPLRLISPATEKRISASLGELYRELVPIGLHPTDAAARGIEDGDLVRVWNDLGCVETTARLDDNLRPGVACLPKGLWSHNTRNGSTSNALVPDHLSDLGGGACFNDARVEIERIDT